MKDTPTPRRESYYRGALIGLGLVAITVFLIFGLTVEMTFGERYFGPDGELTWKGLKIGIAVTFLAFLIIRDQPRVAPLEKVQRTLFVAFMACLLAIWGVAYTNRALRGPRQHYSQQVTLVSYRAFQGARMGNVPYQSRNAPDYYEAEVETESGEHYTFRTQSALYHPGLVGEKVALPLVRGRWGQDFIATRSEE